MSETTADRIRRELDSRGMTAGKLATKIGVSRPTAYSWVSKDAPSIPSKEHLRKLAQLFGVSEIYLLHGTEQEAVHFDLLLAILQAVEEEAATQDVELTNEQRAKLATTIYRHSNLVSGPDIARLQEMIALLT